MAAAEHDPTRPARPDEPDFPGSRPAPRERDLPVTLRAAPAAAAPAAPAAPAASRRTCPEPVPGQAEGPVPRQAEGPGRRAVLAAARAAPLAAPLLPAPLAAALLPLTLDRHAGLEPASAFSGTKEGKGRCIPDQVRDDGKGTVSHWTRALAAFRRAEAAVAALEGHPDEEAFGRAHDRFNILFRRLLAHPAPDIAALADKLEIAAAAELADLTYTPLDLEALAQDARRLALRSS